MSAAISTHEKVGSNVDLYPSGTAWNVAHAGYIGLRGISAVLLDRTPLREMSRFHGLGMLTMEGFMRPQQFRWFEQLFADHQLQNIGETGFNGGHSAFAFAYLGASRVTSFDSGEHSYSRPAADFLPKRFPHTQFELVVGDSRETVPTHTTPTPFDAVFINGGHSQEVAESDLVGMRHLSQPNGLVIVDDYTDKYPWRIGPKVAYDQAVNDGIIEHLEVAAGEHRVWALGQYAVA